MQRAVYTGVLVRAAEILGGTEALREYLGVSQVRLATWMRGHVNPPPDIFLRAVDLLVEHNLKEVLKQLAERADQRSDGS